VLDARLFHAGHMPAVDVGISVSRVGGRPRRRPCGTLGMFRLDYAQFLELEMFTASAACRMRMCGHR